MSTEEKVIPVHVAAEHYVDGMNRGKAAERERILRVILSEIRLAQIQARRDHQEYTREYAAVQQKLNLIYEMVKE